LGGLQPEIEEEEEAIIGIEEEELARLGLQF